MVDTVTETCVEMFGEWVTETWALIVDGTVVAITAMKEILGEWYYS